MITKISHLGIAVKDLKSASEMYKKLLGSEPSEVEFVSEQKVNVIKFKVGESTIELLEGTSPDSHITKFIAKHGEGMHHIAYETHDLNTELLRLAVNSIELINEEPTIGADNRQIAFVNPGSASGVLTEICQH